MSQELTLVLIVVLAVSLAITAFAYSFKAKARRQSEIAAFHAPSSLVEVIFTEPGEYVSTTYRGDWLNRIVVHGLGFKSKATIVVNPESVLIDRGSAAALFIPRENITQVDQIQGSAGKFVEPGGLVRITYLHQGTELDTALRLAPEASMELIQILTQDKGTQ